jgi:hypothetical protein
LGRISFDRKILLKEIAATVLMIFFDRFNSPDDSPDGRRMLENNLTEVNFQSCCNVSILVEHLRVRSDDKLAG